jgi:hypothetical protein
MQKYQRGAAGGGQPVLTRASLLFSCPAPSTGVAIAVDGIAVAKKEEIH